SNKRPSCAVVSTALPLDGIGNRNIKGHAKSRRWDLYGVEAYRVAKNSKARRASDDRSESYDRKPEPCDRGLRFETCSNQRATPQRRRLKNMQPMKYKNILAAITTVLVLAACGQKVEVPPAHVGKIMTKDGYQDNLIPTSKFRLGKCWAYCDRLVLLDVSDKAYQEAMTIFIPEDKLNLDVTIRATLSINPKKTAELFNAIAPTEVSGDISTIANEQVYRTYASQIIQAQVREYLSKLSISEIASSNEKINSDLRIQLGNAIEALTPFSVRFVGITNLKYPKIITDAQESAAERREAIQKEEAQLAISKAQLERELQEARLQRAIDKEKAETEAMSQAVLAQSVDSRVLQLRKLENERAWIEKWNGQLPTTTLSDAVPMVSIGK
ncbi:SPFH domain-containing protein, partial [Comamonas sp.]